MLYLGADNTYIGKVRVISSHNVRHDSLATQLRLRTMLNATTLRPMGLSASAIICIRNFRDPLPGTVRLHDMHPTQRWEQAVTDALKRLMQQAIYPIREVVPLNAEVIIFADQSELLACLAHDWCEGSAYSRWWWQSLFRGKDIAQVVQATWLTAPQYVPAALHHLSQAGKAISFVQALPVTTVTTLVQQVLYHFALPDISVAVSSIVEARVASDIMHTATIDTVTTPIRIGRGPQEERELFTVSSSLEPDEAQYTQSIPWQQWIPECEAPSLSPAQRTLLAIGLMVQRMPAVLRSPSFIHSLHQWQVMYADSVPTSTATGTALEHRAEQIALYDEPVEQGITPMEIASPDHAPSTPSQHTSTTTHPIAEQATTQLFHDKLPVAESRHRASIETAFGGVFYLINLALFLELYGDFTMPLRPGINLPIWNFIALVGQSLLGEKLQGDPLWSLLARLAGRYGHELPANTFAAPEGWYIPRAWLTPFSQRGVWHWCVADGRFRVLHPEQFLIVDTPLNGQEPFALLASLLHQYTDVPAHELRHAPFTWETATTPLTRWLDWLLPYLRVRLQYALGLAESERVAHILCEQSARVFVTETHVDVVFDLNALPIEIRLAGLDRDPGWVPAASRFVAFHFEQGQTAIS